MARKSFYLDTCIWLNLFKKEHDLAGNIPLWKTAKDFIETVMFSESDEIIYSGFVLKEIKYKLKNKDEFAEKLQFLRKEEKFRFEPAHHEDYNFARKLESESGFKLSFYDCLHIAMCKRLSLILVTRDKELIKLAERFIETGLPESFIPKKS
ncbi:MAG: PIN domain-containing protein [Candidatus Woesearchaeota archaeon]